jgi:uncharacterized protein YjeT (DUF2065 family)
MNNPEPPVDTLGGNIERAKLIHDSLSTNEQVKKWIKLSFALLLPLVLVNGLVYAFLELVVARGDATNNSNADIAVATGYDSLLSTTDTHPNSLMDDSEFQVYLGFFLWVTIIVTGLGFEFVAFLMFLPAKWTGKLQSYWILAQSLFALLVATAVGMAISHNYAALLVFVVGMWKFGFPQTITIMYLALNDTSLRRLKRIGFFVNAIGLITHHTAGGLAISMSLPGVLNTVNGRVVLDVIVIAMMQHWVFFLRYVNKNTYVALEIILEMWFEWVTLSNLEGLFANHWTAALFGGTFLVSHWCFLVAGAIELFIEKTTPMEELPSNDDRHQCTAVTDIYDV